MYDQRLVFSKFYGYGGAIRCDDPISPLQSMPSRLTSHAHREVGSAEYLPCGKIPNRFFCNLFDIGAVVYIYIVFHGSMSRLPLYFSAKVVFLGSSWNFSVGIFGGYKKRAAMVAALCVVRSKSLVYDHGGEILLEENLGTLELLAGVLLHLFELVFPAHGLPFVYAEAVVGEYLYALYLLVLA